MTDQVTEQAINQYYLKPTFVDGQPTVRLGHLNFNEGDALQAWYDAIGCDCIDIVYAEIHGFTVDLVVDDEGLLKIGSQGGEHDDTLLGFQVTTDTGHTLTLAGTLVFSKANAEGDTVSSEVRPRDIENMLATRRIRPIAFKGRDENQAH